MLAIVATAAGWLIWKELPPYSPGFHEAVAAADAKAGDTRPQVGRCEVFPPDNVWNTPIDGLRKDPQSDAYIRSIGPLDKLHPDFGSNPRGGIPYSDVPPNTPPATISFGYAEESDPGPYPIPYNAPVEGGPDATGDRHILLVDQQHCILYEIFDAELKPNGTWETGSGARYDLASNHLRPQNVGSADAAGLPILPGLVRYDEVASGAIHHALRFTIPHTRGAFVWPARHKASRIMDPDVAPMGERFRLRADYDITRFSRADRVILTALKRYGMFLADNGGAMFLSGAPDKRWDDADLHQLSKVAAEDFEAVDESQWESDSARVDPALVPRP